MRYPTGINHNLFLDGYHQLRTWVLIVLWSLGVGACAALVAWLAMR